MTKYRIKEYQGKFTVEEKQNPTFWQCIGLVKYQKWKELYIKTLPGLPKKYTHDTLEEAKKDGELWIPLKAGFFQGSYTRFEEIAESYKKTLNELRWI